MARILPSYDWSNISRHNVKARSRNYPWDKWLDGRIYVLTSDEDFDGPATSMERVIRTSANRRKIKVRVRVTEDDAVVLQAHEEINGTIRKVTKSPTKAQVAERVNGRPASAASKVKATKAPAKAKRPTKAAPAKASKPVSKRAPAKV